MSEEIPGQAEPVRARRLPPPLPVPLPPLDSSGLPAVLGYAAHQRRDMGSEQWLTIAAFPNAAEWHRAKAALAAEGIECLMGDGDGIAPGARETGWADGIRLKVPDFQVSRAIDLLPPLPTAPIVFCPECGAEGARRTWSMMKILVALISLGLFAWSVPSRWQCPSCHVRWYGNGEGVRRRSRQGFSVKANRE